MYERTCRTKWTRAVRPFSHRLIAAIVHRRILLKVNWANYLERNRQSMVEWTHLAVGIAALSFTTIDVARWLIQAREVEEKDRQNAHHYLCTIMVCACRHTYTHTLRLITIGIEIRLGDGTERERERWLSKINAACRVIDILSSILDDFLQSNSIITMINVLCFSMFSSITRLDRLSLFMKYKRVRTRESWRQTLLSKSYESKKYCKTNVSQKNTHTHTHTHNKTREESKFIETFFIESIFLLYPCCHQGYSCASARRHRQELLSLPLLSLSLLCARPLFSTLRLFEV
jgi:hypothetical protein